MYGCELWKLNNKKIEALRIAWRKIKRRMWKLQARAHNIIVHNLRYNFDMCLDMRIIKFVYNVLNHSDEICHNLLYTKFNFMRSTIQKIINTSPININVLSDRDWSNDLEHLFGKGKMHNFPSYFQVHQQLVMWLNHVHFEIILSFVMPFAICKLIKLLCTD